MTAGKHVEKQNYYWLLQPMIARTTNGSTTQDDALVLLKFTKDVSTDCDDGLIADDVHHGGTVLAINTSVSPQQNWKHENSRNSVALRACGFWIYYTNIIETLKTYFNNDRSRTNDNAMMIITRCWPVAHGGIRRQPIWQPRNAPLHIARKWYHKNYKTLMYYIIIRIIITSI